MVKSSEISINMWSDYFIFRHEKFLEEHRDFMKEKIRHHYKLLDKQEYLFNRYPDLRFTPEAAGIVKMANEREKAFFKKVHNFSCESGLNSDINGILRLF